MSDLPEFGSASAHNLALADEFGAEFTAIECEVDVEVYTVEDSLRGIHALEIGFQVLAREIRSKCHDLLDPCYTVSRAS